MTHPIRDPNARKVQIGISLSLAALDMADAVVAACAHSNRSALLEKLIRDAAEEHLDSPDCTKSDLCANGWLRLS